MYEDNIMKPRDIDIGTVFGDLTILDRVKIDGRCRYLCKCSCGGTTYTYLHELERGDRKHCGDYQNHKAICKPGDKYSKLTAIKAMDKHSGPGGRKWLFKCVCGKEIIRTIQKVAYYYRKNPKAIQSCGCVRTPRNNSKLLPVEIVLLHRATDQYKQNAKKKGRIYNLSFDEASKILLENCHYCGKKPSRKIKNTRGSILVSGIDRLDSNSGYVLNNVVSCCKTCNTLKKNLDYNEFLIWILAIYENLDLGKKDKSTVYSKGGEFTLENVSCASL